MQMLYRILRLLNHASDQSNRFEFKLCEFMPRTFKVDALIKLATD